MTIHDLMIERTNVLAAATPHQPAPMMIRRSGMMAYNLALQRVRECVGNIYKLSGREQSIESKIPETFLRRKDIMRSADTHNET